MCDVYQWLEKYEFGTDATINTKKKYVMVSSLTYLF